MLELIKTLKETPLPIVLVIGGLIFLLIPFIQKIQAKEIGVETTNQLGAGIIGFVLLVIGIGLYIIPSGTATSTLSTAIPPTAIVSQFQEPASTQVLPIATDNLQQPTAYIAPTAETSPECTPPNGLIPLWYDVPIIWSKGIWGSSNMPNFMSALGEVDSNDPDFGQFQIWVDPCSFKWHGYIDGARFWAHTPNIGQSFPVSIGGTTATTIDVPKNTGIWGFGNPSK